MRAQTQQSCGHHHTARSRPRFPRPSATTPRGSEGDVRAPVGPARARSWSRPRRAVGGAQRGGAREEEAEVEERKGGGPAAAWGGAEEAGRSGPGCGARLRTARSSRLGGQSLGRGSARRDGECPGPAAGACGTERRPVRGAGGAAGRAGPGERVPGRLPERACAARCGRPARPRREVSKWPPAPRALTPCRRGLR